MSLPPEIEDFDPNGVGLRNGRFAGLPFDEVNARIVMLSIPWDATVSYVEGTSSGAANILEASAQLDLFDPDHPEAYKMGLYLRPASEKWQRRNERCREKAKQYIDFLEQGGEVEQSPEMQTILTEINEYSLKLKNSIRKESKKLLKQGKLVGIVGGEHSCPLGLLEQLSEVYADFGVLQIDAHMDLRRSYEGFDFSHASIFHNALDLPSVSRLVQVGIRDFCHEEVARVRESQGRIKVFYDHAIRERLFRGRPFDSICDDILSELPEQVYVSFDIDGLKPYLCPHTGTPVPGGLDFPEAIHLLNRLVRSGRKIIGFDLSEVAGLGHEWDGNVGARVLYRLANRAGASQGWI